MTHRSTWKKAERRVAAFLGTSRTPLSGRNSGHTRSDTLHPSLFVETKFRERSAVWSLWQKVRDLAKREKKTPVLALLQKNHDGFLLVVHSDDLDRFLNAISASRGID